MRFIELFERLDTTQSTNEKKVYLRNYFSSSDDETVIYAVHALTNASSEKAATSKHMKKAASAIHSVPAWLFKESYDAVGDLSETISLLVGGEPALDDITQWYSYIRRLRKAKGYQKHIILNQFYSSHGRTECFLFNKLLTGTFRVGVGKTTVINALSDALGVEEVVLERRLLGSWKPHEKTISSLKRALTPKEEKHKPFPFHLAYPIDNINEIDAIQNWVFEPKYDGIRVQIIIDDYVSLWSRKGELITEQFPEFKSETLENSLVIDGELLAYKERPLPFTKLQKRLGRENPSHSMQKDIPVVIIAYDVLRYNGKDIRSMPLTERQAYIPETTHITKTPQHTFSHAEEAIQAMEKTKRRGVEGFMLKKKDSVYKAGRVKGSWWKWKHAPYTLDCVLMYAEKGRGRRAGKYTDYTFGVWKGNDIVPIARAYSGLTNNEIEELDSWIKNNTKNTFGPVKEVEPLKVVEIAFQSIARKNTKKSGFSLRFPRIKRLRRDLTVEDADTVKDCETLFSELQH